MTNFYLTASALVNAQQAIADWEQNQTATIYEGPYGVYAVAAGRPWDLSPAWRQTSPEELEALLEETVPKR